MQETIKKELSSFTSSYELLILSRGVVTVDVALKELSIDQCPGDFTKPNAFKNTARCHYESQYVSSQWVLFEIYVKSDLSHDKILKSLNCCNFAVSRVYPVIQISFGSVLHRIRVDMFVAIFILLCSVPEELFLCQWMMCLLSEVLILLFALFIVFVVHGINDTINIKK